MSHSPLAKRFAKAFAAQGLGQAISLVTQLVSVPLFLSMWGKERYGEWILLSAIPAYLTIADLSFGAAAANEMTMLAGAGDQQRAQRIYQSTWVLILILSALVTLASVLFFVAVPFDRWMKMDLPHGVVVTSALFLVGQIVLAQQGAVFSAAYRAGGHYAGGLMVGNAQRIVEFLVLVAVLRSGGGFVALTGWVFLVRAVSYLAVYVHLLRIVPWLRLGFRDFDKEALRPLVGPALSYNAVPLGTALNLQGTLFVVGALFGPAAVGAFSSMRTLSRFVWQAVLLIANSVWPEFSQALGAGDLDLARRLHRRACQAGTWVAILASSALLVVGPWLFHRWTKGQYALDMPVFVLLLVGITINSLWSVSYTVSISINRHQRIALLYFAFAGLGVVLSAVLGKAFGLVGVALGLIVVEALMVYFAVSASLRILEEPTSAYASLVKPPFGWLARRLSSALR